MSIKPKNFANTSYCKCVGRQRALQTETKPNTQKTELERRGVSQTDRKTSKERQGEPKTHSRQMEKPESPRAAL